MKKDIKCGVPLGSILGPLLLLFYVKYLPNSSNVLFPIMFVSDTNLFFENSNVNKLFKRDNDKLSKINKFF